MTKATFKAKIVIESTRLNKKFVSYSQIKKIVEKGLYDIEFIEMCLSNDCEPTIIIKDRIMKGE